MKYILICIFTVHCALIHGQLNCDSINGSINNYTGTCSTYHKNGKLAKFKSYEKGLLHGKYEEFHFREIQLAEAYFEKGNIKDTAQRFYSNGNIRLVIALDSMKNGSLVRYYKNGNIHVEGFFTKGLRSGIWKTYDSTGKLTSKNLKTENEQLMKILANNPNYEWKHTSTDEFFLGIF